MTDAVAPPTSAHLLRLLAEQQAMAATSADEQAAMQDRRATDMAHLPGVASLASETAVRFRATADHHRAMEQALLDGARALEAELQEESVT